GLCQCSFKRAGINLEKEIALLYDAAFLVIARDNVALHLRVDVGIDEAVQCGHAFQHARHIFRRNSRHENLRRTRHNLSGLARTTIDKEPCNEQQAEHHGSFHNVLIAERFPNIEQGFNAALYLFRVIVKYTYPALEKPPSAS